MESFRIGWLRIGWLGIGQLVSSAKARSGSPVADLAGDLVVVVAACTSLMVLAGLTACGGPSIERGRDASALWVVDRFEGDRAVLVRGTDDVTVVEAARLGGGVREGDVVGPRFRRRTVRTRRARRDAVERGRAMRSGSSAIDLRRPLSADGSAEPVQP